MNFLPIIHEHIDVISGIILILGVAIYLLFDFKRVENSLIKDSKNFEADFSHLETHIKSGSKSSNKLVSKFFENYVCTLPTQNSNTKLLVHSEPVSFMSTKTTELLENSMGARFTGAITAIALFCTFILISLSVSKIGTAIKQTSDTAEHFQEQRSKQTEKSVTMTESPMEEKLGEAVSLMASKFLLSAIGIILTLIFQLYTTKHIKERRFDFERVFRFLNNFCITSEALQAQLAVEDRGRQIESIEASSQASKEHSSLLSRIEARLEENHQKSVHSQSQYLEKIQQHFRELETALSKLTNIDVNIRNLGQEVLDGLQNIITKPVMDSIERILSDQKSQIEIIATSLSESISKELNSNLGKLLDEFKGEFLKLSEKLNEKGESQLDSVIRDLTNSLQGNIGGSATELNTALSQFANTMPTLKETLDQLVAQISAQTRESAEVAERERQLMNKQFSDTAENLKSLSSNLSSQFTSMQSELNSSRGELAKESKETLSALNKNAVDSLSQLGDLFSDKFQSVAKIFDGIQGELRKTLALTNDTSNSFGQIQGSMKNTMIGIDGVYKTISSSLTKMESVSERLMSGSESLKDFPPKVREAVQGITESISSQTTSIAAQSQIWNNLIVELSKQILDSSKANSVVLDTTFKRMKDYADTIGTNVSNSVEDLSTSVSALNSSLSRGK